MESQAQITWGTRVRFGISEGKVISWSATGNTLVHWIDGRKSWIPTAQLEAIGSQLDTVLIARPHVPRNIIPQTNLVVV